MADLTLSADRTLPLRILCLGAHSDDIEIGCGGTLLKLSHSYADLHVRWIVFSADQDRRREAEESAAAFLEGVAARQVNILDFRDGYFPYDGAAIKDYFEQLKAEMQPDLIFTHCRYDLHQDHRTLCDLTWNTYRSHLILEYEIAKYDGDLGAPNVFMGLDAALCERKVNYLLQFFGTQRSKHWFTRETFMALMRLRGVEAKATGGYAEAFYGRKIELA
ncbi:MAG: GlcNAc-PI de-N-acetylase [Chloroflexota bacterium]|jgi:LmbE family N-acetylglucosaminyl deacetylase|nr:PIG-L family deacetylase [Caldilinea sp.]GIK75334.1 MAG: GlcNAc-PI de-N-acetylase [Chloroflexota bacterium]